MSIVLNNEQELAKNELLEFILTPSELKQDSIIVLSGAAGTGKTTLLKSVIDNYKAIKELNKIINMPTTQIRWEFTAMTHKAARVLSQVIKLPVNTLHHELRIRPLKYGYYFCGYDLYLEPSMDKKIIVVDEASYIDSEVLNYICELVSKEPKLQFILIGDPYQLPPVGMDHAPVFNAGFKTVHLEQSVRQSNTPHLAQTVNTLRQAATQGKLHIIKADNKEVLYLDKKTWDKQIISTFNQGISAKVIQYTNHQVQASNKKINRQLTGNREIKVGDTMIIHGKLLDGSIVPLDDEVTVLGIDGYHPNGTSELQLPYYELCLEDNSGIVHHRLVIQDHKAYTGFAAQHKTLRSGPPYIWHLRYAYACTVHKSQGSTYDEVFINLNSYRSVYKNNPAMALKLLYVAVSRARNKVYFTGDIG
ncbi:ATP-dependent DNA helicase [Moraxella catarrhalis]|uniref:ATP-dependent DNA helicase n=1 Tax=Moraxella catarrhalis TaxID=480 RepID=UPI000202AF4C|nr:AAA family ATPase [Moraxella catarrhalis]EGE23137.1 exodeoxyribonuclease V [Moraxella catarrhalis CO72]